MVKDVRLLDCTLRDGGYYNAWDFSQELVQAYIKAMTELPVDYIEFGFRFFGRPEKQFLGMNAYSNDNYIRSLDLPVECPPLGVMLNGSDLINYSQGVEQAILDLFKPTDDSPIKFVRVACHNHQLEDILPAITQLKKFGYKTTINMMQIAGIPTERIIDIGDLCSKYPVDVLYFADSLGSLDPNGIKVIVEALKCKWKGTLGFHGHNNMEQALPNSLKAIELGVEWIDSTVMGMGRGPGNTCTEYLAIELENRHGRKQNFIPLLNLIKDFFHPLKKDFDWGPNLFYYMAGVYGIHPTYIQEMSGNTKYKIEDILSLISRMKIKGGSHYSIENIEVNTSFYNGDVGGSWVPSDIFENKCVLILGSGPGISKYRQIISQFILSHKPIVLSFNLQSNIDENLIDFRVASHPIRILAEYNEYKILPQPLITPLSQLPEDVKNALKGKNVHDFGLKVEIGKYDFYSSYCVVPNMLVFAYSIAIANSGNAKKIFLAGFDGYETDDPRNTQIDHILFLYNEKEKKVEIESITPTRYNLPIRSIYSI